MDVAVDNPKIVLIAVCLILIIILLGVITKVMKIL